MYWDNPEHRVSSYAVSSSRDTGGGTALAYTLAQFAIPCLINTAGASEQELYAQQGIVVTHTIGIKSSVITTPITRGMKVVSDDRSESFHVKGIRSGRAFRSIPAFTFLDVEQQL